MLNKYLSDRVRLILFWVVVVFCGVNIFVLPETPLFASSGLWRLGLVFDTITFLFLAFLFGALARYVWRTYRERRGRRRKIAATGLIITVGIFAAVASIFLFITAGKQVRAQVSQQTVYEGSCTVISKTPASKRQEARYERYSGLKGLLPFTDYSVRFYDAPGNPYASLKNEYTFPIDEVTFDRLEPDQSRNPDSHENACAYDVRIEYLPDVRRLVDIQVE
jgi:hypothetical protein